MKIYVKEILQIMNLFYFCSFHSSYTLLIPFLYPSYTLLILFLYPSVKSNFY